jgi:hypothetical protein
LNDTDLPEYCDGKRTGSYYLNDLFVSKNADDLLKFYDSFNCSEKLLEWMKNRPQGQAIIKETDGDERYVVVIPTKDTESAFAVSSRDTVFKGLKIVFVESGPDPYFNIARNSNIGLRYALKYNPEWIIDGQDDMLRVDDISVLTRQLSSIDPRNTNVVIPLASSIPSTFPAIGRSTVLREEIMRIRGKPWRKRISIMKKFEIDLLAISNKIFYRPLYKPLLRFPANVVKMLSANFLRSCEGRVYDEIYINCFEDLDFFWRVAENGGCSFVDFKIATVPMGANSLGKYNIVRRLREICSNAYLNMKVRKGLLRLEIPFNSYAD